MLAVNHPDTATSVNNLASFYEDVGNYAQAEPLYQRALSIREKALGPDHPDTAQSLNNLADLYGMISDYAKEEPLLRRALSIREKILGPNHPDTASSLNNLAVLYVRMGDYVKAEPRFQRALSINEKILGPNHPGTATSVNNLASLYEDMGNYAKAEPLFQRGLSMNEKALGPDHPDTARSLNNLATLYMLTGDYTKAESLYQRALSINEKALGPNHPHTAGSLDNLGFVFIETGKVQEAKEMEDNAEKSRLSTMANILSFASEQQRLDYQSSQNPYSVCASLGDAPEIALVLFREKGVVLDSLLEDRLMAEAGTNLDDRAILDQLRSTKQRLTRLLLEIPKDVSAPGLQKRSAELEGLTKEVEQMEGALARHVAGLGRARRALGVTVEQVQTAVPTNAALVEWLRYRHYLGKNKWEDRYGAIVLVSSGQPKWVSLGAATNIETDIKLYQQSVRHQTSDRQLGPLLQKLYGQLWSPLEALLPGGTKAVILSPDGQLNFLSFATLISPDDEFLGQKYSVRYVASGRDLLREVKPGPASDMVIFANPDFSGTGRPASTNSSNNLMAMRSLEMRDLQNLYLPPLPGTAKESAALAEEAQQWNWPAKVFLQGDATEAQLGSVRSPHILHLATHGFFLPETDAGESNSSEGQRGIGGMAKVEPFPATHLPASSGGSLKRQVVLKNPMLRSGLALAGAQATLDAWKRGEVPPMDNDGIVTAEEVGGLKLEGTWLVTLSACDTGTGEARSGEGVLGLRRGFVQAGAQNLLMTLWSVADEETAKLMVDFYSAARKTGNAPLALAEVQRDWLIKLRKERGLSDAVRIAGPFIMSSQGPAH